MAARDKSHQSGAKAHCSPVEQAGAPPIEARQGALVCATAAFVFAFISLKVHFGFPYLFDDEHRYFAMGQLMSRGAFPYRDFILTHPPLGVLLIALCDATFGSHYLLYKGLLLLFSIGIAALLFVTAREEYGSLAGFFSCALLLSSRTYFIESTYMRGFNLGLLLIALAAFLSRKLERQWIAGAVLGSAFLTGVYAVIPLLAFLLCQFRWRGKRRALEILTGFLLVALPLQIPFLLIAGRAYFDQVYLFHAKRQATWTWTFNVLRDVGPANLPLFACGIAGLFLVRAKHLWQERLLIVIFTPAILSFSKIFNSYFLLPMYFLAIAGGALLAQACTRMRNLGLALALGIGFLLAASLGHSFHHYVEYNETWVVPGVEEIATTVRAGSTPKDLIFGGVVAPLFSFLTQRGVLYNALYTDTETFAAGLLRLEDVREALRTDPRVKFVVMTNRGGYLSVRGGHLDQTLLRYFRRVGRYSGPAETLYLFERVYVETKTPAAKLP